MPNFTIYISEEDVPRWKALENKSQFLREALYVASIQELDKIKKPVPKVIDNPVIMKKELEELQEVKSMQFCKNGHPIPLNKDRCLGKKCIYSGNFKKVVR